jgi:hypothetical protein
MSELVATVRFLNIECNHYVFITSPKFDAASIKGAKRDKGGRQFADTSNHRVAEIQQKLIPSLHPPSVEVVIKPIVHSEGVRDTFILSDNLIGSLEASPLIGRE